MPRWVQLLPGAREVGSDDPAGTAGRVTTSAVRPPLLEDDAMKRFYDSDLLARLRVAIGCMTLPPRLVELG